MAIFFFLSASPAPPSYTSCSLASPSYPITPFKLALLHRSSN